MMPFFKTSFFIFLSIIIVSCGENEPYYEQIKKNTSVIDRATDLNKSINEIRKKEKGKLTKEEVDYMEYEYSIGKNDTYNVSYLFDDKGCYEIGVDSYFATEEDAKNVLDGFVAEINKSAYGAPDENDNQLYRWLSDDKAVSIELDYVNIDRGMIVLTIFANE